MLKLVPHPSATPVPEVVDALETMLARAKAGDIVSVAITAATPCGDTIRHYAVQEQRLALIAGLAISQHELIAMNEPVREPPAA